MSNRTRGAKQNVPAPEETFEEEEEEFEDDDEMRSVAYDDDEEVDDHECGDESQKESPKAMLSKKKTAGRNAPSARGVKAQHSSTTAAPRGKQALALPHKGRAKGLAVEPTKTSSSGITKKKSINMRKFDRYIFRVMKTVDRDFRIGRKGMDIANAFLLDIIDRVVSEAATLSKRSSKQSLTWRDACCAAMLTLPGELAKMGIAEGQRAMSQYARSIEGTAS